MVQLTAAKCPQCGADIEVNPELEKSICQYCGTTILVQEAIQKIELSGTVKVAGIKNRDDYLDQAKKHFKVGEYFEAKDCLSNIMQEDSFDIEAYCELIKNDLELLKKENFDLKISDVNPKYNSKARKYYDEYINTYDRVLKIDENNEREKYLGTYLEEIAKYEEANKQVEERLAKNKEIVDRLNEDYNKIKSYDFFDEYNTLIEETIHGASRITSAIYNSINDYKYNERYKLKNYSKITQDGILFMNYEKTEYLYKLNPATVELYSSNANSSTESFEEIDARFNDYCSKIDDVLNKIEKKRKAKLRKYRLLMILWCILFVIIAIPHIYLLFDDIYKLIGIVIIIDSWLFGSFLIPWYEKIKSGLKKYKKK